MSDNEELVLYKSDRAEVAREDVFGIIQGSLTTDEKIVKLLGMIPVAFQIVDEARETIARLREELERKESE